MIKYYTEKQKKELTKKQYVKNYSKISIDRNTPVFIKKQIENELAITYDKYYK